MKGAVDRYFCHTPSRSREVFYYRKEKGMKKIISAAAVLAAISMLSVSAFAADIYVTISDENGKLAVSQEKVEVNDVDGDGTITVNDTLIETHDKFFDGGADSGYASDVGDYGLYITRLWGVENGGSYGYYVNNAAAMSLADTVKSGDCVSAFVYTDTTAFSDTFCYFDGFINEYNVSMLEVAPGAETTLTLLAAAFDENWAPITVPVEGAEITIDGKKTGVLTDADGKATIKLPDSVGEHKISAVSDKQTLVPPVATIDTADEAAATEVADDESVSVTGDVDAAVVSSKGSPDTGIADVAAAAGIAVIAAGAFIVAKKRK